MYHFTWQRILGGMPSSLDVKYVYLKAPVDCLQARTKRRAREGESNISSAYMERLCELHDEWMATVPDVSGKVTIDAQSTEDEIFKATCDAIGGWITDHLGLGGGNPEKRTPVPGQERPRTA